MKHNLGYNLSISAELPTCAIFDFFYRLPSTTHYITSNKGQPYGIPAHYNAADHPPVKLRHHNHRLVTIATNLNSINFGLFSSDQSETQRKRRSKNRLSNRRSTGYVSQDMVEEAIRMGANGSE